MQIILIMEFTVKALVTLGTVKLNYKVPRKVFIYSLLYVTKHMQFTPGVEIKTEL
jgi:hypothetical protein